MMASDHFLQLSLPVAIFGQMANIPQSTYLPVAIAAGLYNAWPDVGPWIKAEIDLHRKKNLHLIDWWDTHIFGFWTPTRGDLYAKMHRTKEYKGTLAKWFPLHYFGGDKWLHDDKGPWFPRLWYVALPFWLFEALLIFLYFG